MAADQVGQLYGLQMQRTQMLLDVTPSNFQVRRLDSLISITRLSLFDYIGEAKTSLESESDELAERIQVIERKLYSLPKSEREILEIERRLAINDRFYGYLLEQRATNLLSLIHISEPTRPY